MINFSQSLTSLLLTAEGEECHAHTKECHIQPFDGIAYILDNCTLEVGQHYTIMTTQHSHSRCPLTFCSKTQLAMKHDQEEH